MSGLSKQCLALLFLCAAFGRDSFSQAPSFTLQAVKAYPYPTELTASAGTNRLAWAFAEEGRRNVYVAEGPAFSPRKLTAYTTDDGQEITGLQISADGRWVVYVRGGDHGGNWGTDQPVNTKL